MKEHWKYTGVVKSHGIEWYCWENKADGRQIVWAKDWFRLIHVSEVRA